MSEILICVLISIFLFDSSIRLSIAFIFSLPSSVNESISFLTAFFSTTLIFSSFIFLMKPGNSISETSSPFNSSSSTRLIIDSANSFRFLLNFSSNAAFSYSVNVGLLFIISGSITSC